MHCAAGLGFVAAIEGLPWLEGAAALLLGGHAWLRRPRRPPLLSVGSHQRWAAPELGLFDLRPASGARFSTWWIRLVLVGEHGALTVVLVRDQLDARFWWALQAMLRCRPPRSTAEVERGRAGLLE